ncbi:hypothetical protein THAOC_34576 [Thalassiosira oceanica]|uniref:Glutathione peroxidase n=1 Tax=Thalassiosira oceanica TaxID=159749 RepID=K0RJA7_THAOC|nr:hypothetical protein THAOC_34576 [Thalassiosira oceanica]|eukprot:EJK46742.1 hypothetical protein THAOC_34576 [Thalassiosira oceanica]
MTRRRPTKGGGGASSRSRRTHLDLAPGEDEKISGSAKSNNAKMLRLASALVCAAFALSNYKELALLSQRYKSRGFNVLAFPSNDFNQEKDTNAEILQYVNDHFPEVKFPIFSRGSLADSEVFKLCKEMTGESVRWNFHKYLVNGKGEAVKSYGHRIQPMAI